MTLLPGGKCQSGFCSIKPIQENNRPRQCIFAPHPIGKGLWGMGLAQMALTMEILFYGKLSRDQSDL